MSAAINDIAVPTPIAAVNNGDDLRLYELDNDGGVREIQSTGGKWTGGQEKNKIGTVRLTSPLSATSLKLEHIRVYGIGQDHTISEFAFDSGHGWYGGDLTGKFKVAPYSSVAAVFLANKLKLRVYVQSVDNTIQEYSWDGKGWYKDQNLGPALPGTAITATSWGNSDSEIHIRVYFQDPERNVIEKAHDPTSAWFDGELSFNVDVPRTPLAVISWDQGKHFRVYYGSPGGTIREKGHDGSGNWYEGLFNERSLPYSRVAGLVASNSDLRVYLQNGHETAAITEFAWSDKGWAVGHQALPPA